MGRDYGRHNNEKMIRCLINIYRDSACYKLDLRAKQANDIPPGLNRRASRNDFVCSNIVSVVYI
jgi:hypothetical protein